MKQYNNYADLITFTRASSGTALRPISYGDELVTNGGFDSDVSGWTAASSASLSVVSNQLRVTNGATSAGYAYQAITTEVGKTYRFTADFINTNNGVVNIGTTVGGFNLFASGQLTTTQTVNATFTATTTTTYIYLGNWFSTSGHLNDFDNISVKEVLFDQPNGTLTLFNHPTNVPRIEYDADGNRLGLLVEESRTNLITYSEDYIQECSGTSTEGFTLNAGIAPDGKNSLIEHSLDSGSTFTYGTYSVSSETTYTFSQWVALGTATNVGYAIYDSTNSSFIVSSSQYSDVSSTLKRKSITFTTPAGCTLIRIYPVRYINNTNLGTTYHWGWQLEVGSFPTSYIPTSGSTATRSADVASIDVSEFGFNSAEGSVVCDIASKNGTATAVYYIGDGTQNNRIMTYAGDASHLIVRASNVEQANIDAGTYTQDKLAATYKQNDFAVSINGGAVVTDTSGDIPSTSIMYIGSNNGSLYYLNGHLKSLRYFPRRLTNAQLQELTS